MATYGDGNESAGLTPYGSRRARRNQVAPSLRILSRLGPKGLGGCLSRQLGHVLPKMADTVAKTAPTALPPMGAGRPPCRTGPVHGTTPVPCGATAPRPDAMAPPTLAAPQAVRGVGPATVCLRGTRQAALGDTRVATDAKATVGVALETPMDVPVEKGRLAPPLARHAAVSPRDAIPATDAVGPGAPPDRPTVTPTNDVVIPGRAVGLPGGRTCQDCQTRRLACLFTFYAFLNCFANSFATERRYYLCTIRRYPPVWDTSNPTTRKTLSGLYASSRSNTQKTVSCNRN